MPENYEGTALDSVFTEQPVEGPMEDVVDETSTVETEPVVNESTKEALEVTRYEIEGVGTFTADEIREMKNGGMRQSDYTKKTQELARQREEMKDAQELYSYLRANPHIVQAMQQAEQNPNSVAFNRAPTVDNTMIRDIAYRQMAMETDIKLNNLRQKYGDIDEVALFNKATELGINDLEFVWKALSYDNRNVNSFSMREQAKAELKEQMEKERDVLSTTVVNSTSSAPISNPSLSNAERRIASAMGMSEDEYLKWK